MGGNPAIPVWSSTASYVNGSTVFFSNAFYTAYIAVPVGVWMPGSPGEATYGLFAFRFVSV